MQRVERIASRILVVRGQRVLVDSDLASLYGVAPKRFNEQFRRNRKRFPDDFTFQLNNQEFANLRSRFATSSWGGRRYLPLVFTEHGALMAATVLNSPQAIAISVFVVRAFVRMREALALHKEIGRRLDQLERRVGTHDHAIAQILAALRQLTQPTDAPRRRIGFM